MIVVELMLGERPEALDAVDVDMSVGKAASVADPIVFAVEPQGIVALKGICIVDTAFAGPLADDGHEGFCRDIADNSGVDPAIPLQ